MISPVNRLTLAVGMVIATLVGQVFDDDEGEQCQALGGLVHLCGGHGSVRHEVIEAAGIAHQLKTQGLEQRAVLVLEVRQLCVQLRVTAADVVTLEQLAKDRRQLGQFG